MEIRRKVFSLLQDENGEERYYSTNEFKMEFNEETGEKMFSEKESKKSNAGKVAAITAGAAVTAVGGLEIANLLKKKTLTPKEKKMIRDWMADHAKNGMSPEKQADMLKRYKKNFLDNKTGIEFVEKGNKAVKGAYNTAKVNTKIAIDNAKEAIDNAKEQIKDTRKTREIRRAEQKSYEDLFKEADARYDRKVAADKLSAEHAEAMKDIPVRVHRKKNGQFTSRKRSN